MLYNNPSALTPLSRFIEADLRQRDEGCCHADKLAGCDAGKNESLYLVLLSRRWEVPTVPRIPNPPEVWIHGLCTC